MKMGEVFDGSYVQRRRKLARWETLQNARIDHERGIEGHDIHCLTRPKTRRTHKSTPTNFEYV